MALPDDPRVDPRAVPLDGESPSQWLQRMHDEGLMVPIDAPCQDRKIESAAVAIVVLGAAVVAWAIAVAVAVTAVWVVRHFAGA